MARTEPELDGDGDGEVLHHVVEVPGGQSLVRGTVRRASDRIVLETMALERLRELQTLVLAIVPDARLVDESTRSAADALAETGPDLPPQDAAPERSRRHRVSCPAARGPLAQRTHPGPRWSHTA